MKLIYSAILILFSVFLQAEEKAGMLKLKDGGSVYYEIAGKGEPVIFLHGGFGDRRMWDSQFKAFSAKYRVIRYDQRGFGKSPAPSAAYSPVADLEYLLDHFKIDKAHLVGNSMGGTLAIDFALLKPSRVASISVVASGPAGVEFPKESMDLMMAVFKTAEQKGLQEAADMWIQNPMVAVASKDPRTAALTKIMIDENAGIFRMKFWPIEKLDPPAAKRLSEIKAPALIVFGSDDTPAVRNSAEIAAAGISGAKKIVIDDADHLPQMVKPEEFNRALGEFLSKLSQ